jgi:hypothetical protein
MKEGFTRMRRRADDGILVSILEWMRFERYDFFNSQWLVSHYRSWKVFKIVECKQVKKMYSQEWRGAQTTESSSQSWSGSDLRDNFWTRYRPSRIFEAKVTVSNQPQPSKTWVMIVRPWNAKLTKPSSNIGKTVNKIKDQRWRYHCLILPPSHSFHSATQTNSSLFLLSNPDCAFSTWNVFVSAFWVCMWTFFRIQIARNSCSHWFRSLISPILFNNHTDLWPDDRLLLLNCVNVRCDDSHHNEPKRNDGRRGHFTLPGAWIVRPRIVPENRESEIMWFPDSKTVNRWWWALAFFEVTDFSMANAEHRIEWNSNKKCCPSLLKVSKKSRVRICNVNGSTNSPEKCTIWVGEGDVETINFSWTICGPLTNT